MIYGYASASTDTRASMRRPSSSAPPALQGECETASDGKTETKGRTIVRMVFVIIVLAMMASLNLAKAQLSSRDAERQACYSACTTETMREGSNCQNRNSLCQNACPPENNGPDSPCTIACGRSFFACFNANSERAGACNQSCNARFPFP